jgi:hypothetical protein
VSVLPTQEGPGGGGGDDVDDEGGVAAEGGALPRTGADWLPAAAGAMALMLAGLLFLVLGGRLPRLRRH